MLSALVAGHRGRASRAAGASAQMCSPMARESPKSGRNGQNHFITVVPICIWLPKRPERGAHICVCAELVGG
eukprot:3686565-Prymnesium_polylepis.1